MNSEALRSLLGPTELFRGLDPALLDDVLASAVTRRLRTGDVLFEQGDAPRRLYAVIEGRLKVALVTAEGAQLAIRFMGPGDVVGCAAVLGGRPYPATATAVAPGAVLVWSAADVAAHLRRIPTLSANAARMVGLRAEEMLQRLRETATERIETRLARALLRLLPDDAAGPHEIGFALSRQDLAELTGATLYTVSRTLSAWKQLGILDGGRRRIVVRDPIRLAALANARPARAGQA